MVVVGVFAAGVVASAQVQQDSVPSAGVPSVPPFLPLSGLLLDPSGTPIAGPAEVTLAIYAEREGGTPLWSEVQTIQADQRGQYAVTLGAATSSGLPFQVFASGGIRWLGVSLMGQAELPRTPILSVPYALKAADADTLGGKPASAFMAAIENRAGAAAGTAAAAADGSNAALAPNVPSPTAPSFIATANPGPGFISQATSGPPLQVSSAVAVANLNADLVDGFHAAAFPKLATANTFTGNQSITGNVTATGSMSASAASFNGNSASPIITAAQSGAAAAIYGSSSAVSGTGIRGDANGSGSPFGILGTSTGSNGTGVRGDGTAFGVSGSSNGAGGSGLWGVYSGSGSGFGAVGLVSGAATDAVGVQGINFNNSGIGVRGVAVKAGATAGVFDNIEAGNILVGQVNGAQQFRVDGGGAVYANSYRDLAGNIVGTGTVTNVASGTGLTGGPITSTGILALDTSFTDARYAPVAHGHNVSQITGAATLGTNLFNGNQDVFGRTFANQSSLPASVIGQHSAASGQSIGVAGISNSTAGVGVEASVGAATGSTTGLLSYVYSPQGVAAWFDNRGGGDLLKGTTTDQTLAFRVDGTGAVYANSYRDLAGNPIPSGIGDITGVGAGSGLTGGGASGDVSVALDTAFTDARYASAAHGHDVSQIANAATLGVNSFSGNQSVTGNLTVQGVVSGAGATTGVTGQATASSGQADGVFGSTASFNGAGVRGTGPGFGVTGSSNNVGMFGTGASVGVVGSTTNGVGVQGQGGTGTAVRAQGGSVGFHASVSGSATAALLDGQSGDLILGRAAGLNKFRVDATGAVYAASYRDLAGDPIPTATGDITGVAAATGLTGGGTAGDVSLGLNIAYTDARYAPVVHGHDVAQITNAATLGANTFTAGQTIQTGNLALTSSGATTGNITKNGLRFLHNYGPGNTFLGENAGNFTMTGFGSNTGIGEEALSKNTTGWNNTAGGAEALLNNTSGSGNTALGTLALSANTTGENNTATGVNALHFNTGNYNTANGAVALNKNSTGNANTATGFQALWNNTEGGGNTAYGVNALEFNTTGTSNVAIGASAGGNATTGSNNIYLGTSVLGIAGESNTMYLGKQGTQTKTFIAGIRGITTANADAIPVTIDSAGQLGTVSSSRRFKEDIRDMRDASRRVLQLRPVTFRYSQAYGDGSKPIQYGLIAEEVADVFPELAVRSADGTVETVHYERLSILLVNELQRQEHDLQEQREDLQRQQQRIDALEQQLKRVLAAREP